MAKTLYSLWMNDAEVQGLKAVQAADGIAVSEQIRQAVRDYLDRTGVMWRPANLPHAAARQTRRTRPSRSGGVP